MTIQKQWLSFSVLNCTYKHNLHKHIRYTTLTKMASSSSSSSSVLCLLLLFLTTMMISLSPLVAADEALIEKTCHATAYYDFCVTALKADNSSGAANTKGLVAILIGDAGGTAADTAAYITYLLKKSARVYWQAGEPCKNHYESAKQSLDKSLKQLQAGQFRSAGNKTSEARGSAEACVADFARFGVTFPFNLETRHEVFVKLCHVVTTIISKLLV